MTAAPLRPNSSDANDVDAVRRYYLRELEPHGLDAREHDVVVMTLEGRTQHEIACKIGVCERTVKSACKSAYAKLDVAGRKELMERFALL